MKVGSSCLITPGLSSFGLNQLHREPVLLENSMERFCDATKMLVRDAVKAAIAAGLNEPGPLMRMRITVEIGHIADLK